MKLGDERLTKEVCVEQVCEVCEEPAKYKHTFLLENCRNNRASSAYSKDDCSWCADDCKYSCEKHKEEVRRDSLMGMSWCSTFSREKFEHMFLHWKKVDIKARSKVA